MLDAKSAVPQAADWLSCWDSQFQKIQPGVTLFWGTPGYLLLDKLATDLTGNGKDLSWHRIDMEDKDPAQLVQLIIQSAKHLVPNFGLETCHRMRQQPGPIYGWEPIYQVLAQELIAKIPESTAFVFEQIHLLNSEPSTLQLFGRHIISFLAPKYCCILIADDPVPRTIFPGCMVCDASNLKIGPEKSLEIAGMLGASISRKNVEQLAKICAGRTELILGLINLFNEWGDSFAGQIIKHANNANQLLAITLREHLKSVDLDNLRALALAARLGYCHPKIIQNVFGENVPLNGPWFQQLTDHWVLVRKIWKDPLLLTIKPDNTSMQWMLSRAASSLLDLGASDKAIEILLDIKEYDRAAAFSAQNIEEMFNIGQWITIQNWLNRLPPWAFTEYPLLLYIQGEIAAARGQIRDAKQHFEKASKLFHAHNEPINACESLLAESAIAIWEKDFYKAQQFAISANLIAEREELPWHQGVGNWQLGYLNAQTGNLEKAVEHFRDARNKLSDDVTKKALSEAESISYKIVEARRQCELHRRAYLQSKRTERAASAALHSFLSSPNSVSSTMIKTLGWAKTPLFVKLPFEEVSSPDGGNHLFTNLLKQLGLVHKSSDSFMPLIPPIQPNYEPIRSSYADSHPETIAQPENQNNTRTETAQEGEYLSTSVKVYLLGNFQLYVDEREVHISSTRAENVLKYLLIHHAQNISREVLMDMFWPDTDPDAARNNLNVAIHHLRQSFQSVTSAPIVLFNRTVYGLNPGIRFSLDVEEFENHLQAGQQLESHGDSQSFVNEFETAIGLYRGDFMQDDPYEDWAIPTREKLRIAYLDVLAHLSHIYFNQGKLASCVALCQLTLERDSCREDTHYLLMRCYCQQGQDYLALRQYQACVSALRNELDVEPAPATKSLAEQIKRHERV